MLETKVRNYNCRVSLSRLFLSLSKEQASVAPSALHCCKSATEYDRQGEAIDRGCSGGNEGGDLAFEFEFEFEFESFAWLTIILRGCRWNWSSIQLDPT